MANSRVPYQVSGNAVGAIVAEAVSLIRLAHNAVSRANTILLAIGLDTDVETVLVMEPGHSYGAALLAIMGGSKTGLDSIASDVVGRLDQG